MLYRNLSKISVGIRRQHNDILRNYTLVENCITSATKVFNFFCWKFLQFWFILETLLASSANAALDKFTYFYFEWHLTTDLELFIWLLTDLRPFQLSVMTQSWKAWARIFKNVLNEPKTSIFSFSYYAVKYGWLQTWMFFTEQTVTVSSSIIIII